MKTYSEIPKSLPVTPLLDKVNYPSDLKQLTKKEMGNNYKHKFWQTALLNAEIGPGNREIGGAAARSEEADICCRRQTQRRKSNS